MLTELQIENIAVIEKAGVELYPGLNVLTGETGAGKTIIIDALDAVLGGRSSRDAVRAGAERATVTAVFELSSAVAKWMEENCIASDDDSLVLTRRITLDGKSACRVNGAPVSVSQLKEIGSLLLDIHGQNDGRKLMDESRHLTYLDGFGAYDGEIRKYREIYEQYLAVVREIKRLSMDEIERERLTESLKYQISELEAADIKDGEEKELLARCELLKNGGRLSEALDGAFALLYGGDRSAAALAGEASELLARASSFSEEVSKAENAVKEAGYLLEDASEQLRDFISKLDFSPEEYDRLETRLKEIRRLGKKYGCDEAGLLEKLSECRARFDDIEFSEDKTARLHTRQNELRKEAKAAAEKLTALRRKAAVELEKRITDELKDLSMPSVRFKAEITSAGGPDGFGPGGQDTVRFLMSANAGEEPGRISKIASGGELSRIMLAMKNVFAEKDMVPTQVFDEIDAGVSGIAAQRVGEKLGGLSRHRQVICITHLPQIAAMADNHLLIEKNQRDGRTFTSVIKLDTQGRKRELARLHGGDNITPTTLKSAEEQLEAAEKYKSGL